MMTLNPQSKLLIMEISKEKTPVTAPLHFICFISCISHFSSETDAITIPVHR